MHCNVWGTVTLSYCILIICAQKDCPYKTKNMCFESGLFTITLISVNITQGRVHVPHTVGVRPESAGRCRMPRSRGALALEPCSFIERGVLSFICLSQWRPIGPLVPWPLASVQYCHLILSFLLHNCFPHLRVWLFSLSPVPPSFIRVFHSLSPPSLSVALGHRLPFTRAPPFHSSSSRTLPFLFPSQDCRAAVSGSAMGDYVLRSWWSCDCERGGRRNATEVGRRTAMGEE